MPCWPRRWSVGGSASPGESRSNMWPATARHGACASPAESRSRPDSSSTRRAVARPSRGQGATFATIDHLVAFVGFFAERPGDDPGTLVESFAEGWWYTAGLPGGLRLFACMTDHDIGRRLRLSEPA